MNVAGSGRVGSSFSIRVAQNNVLGWRWTVEKEHDGFFEPVASGRSLTRKMAKRAITSEFLRTFGFVLR